MLGEKTPACSSGSACRTTNEQSRCRASAAAAAAAAAGYKSSKQQLLKCNRQKCALLNTRCAINAAKTRRSPSFFVCCPPCPKRGRSGE